MKFSGLALVAFIASAIAAPGYSGDNNRSPGHNVGHPGNTRPGNNYGNNRGSNYGNNYGNNHGNNRGNNYGNNRGNNRGNNYGNNRGNNRGNNHRVSPNRHRRPNPFNWPSQGPWGRQGYCNKNAAIYCLDEKHLVVDIDVDANLLGLDIDVDVDVDVALFNTKKCYQTACCKRGCQRGRYLDTNQYQCNHY
ncbi:hypothetical protein DCS_06959 [Drechmeria coniospora]|uniref:Hydrophobin n=1 Tax=Drechmeria coniospora TaxID=98403 RepID=A0A151GD15_DRECN|nr:hypothetical protein DCS_06959 [Drechmeria coniospora]KYK54998.1 hypothetical protein DCS_06959 [Drechmeria coniospora]ODA82372.1 hypothetical protein RJ55_00879 [Drechmeria coniospora]